MAILIKHCVTRPLENTREQMASKLLLLPFSVSLGCALIAENDLATTIGLLSCIIFAIIWLTLFVAKICFGQITHLDTELGRNVRQAVVTCSACSLGFVLGFWQGGAESGLAGSLIALVSVLIVAAFLTGFSILTTRWKSRRSASPSQVQG